ncbi:MAG: hypothetical protein RSD26_08995 [Cellulosilyticaceae bacterium]
MKNSKTRISANEINRFVYCPYQWYYKRYYGTTTLNQKYKELEIASSQHESHFVKGLNHHKKYYFQYRVKKFIQILIVLGIIASVIGRMMTWTI